MESRLKVFVIKMNSGEFERVPFISLKVLFEDKAGLGFVDNIEKVKVPIEYFKETDLQPFIGQIVYVVLIYERGRFILREIIGKEEN